MEDFFEDLQTENPSGVSGQPALDSQLYDASSQAQFDRNPSNVNQQQANDPFDMFEQVEPQRAASGLVNQAIASVYVSAEQQVRKDKLRVIEEQRIKAVREKDQSEREEKEQKKSKAKEFLKQFKQQQEQDIEQRKQQNRQNQEINQQNRKEHNDFKNPWDKVVANIVLKDGEYPGNKDISKMRQSILNKRKDITK